MPWSGQEGEGKRRKGRRTSSGSGSPVSRQLEGTPGMEAAPAQELPPPPAAASRGQHCAATALAGVTWSLQDLLIIPQIK